MKTNSFERAHTKLNVWQEAMELVTKIYKVTGSFPRSEIYGLTSQIRRAAVSIPTNIAEGVARKSSKEYLQFLYIARSSLSELETSVEIAKRLQLLTEIEHADLTNCIATTGRMLSGLVTAIHRKLQNVSHFPIPISLP